MNSIVNDSDPTSASLQEAKVWQLLKEVCDPEVPVLSVLDLGIIRRVEVEQSSIGTWDVDVTITPTYSGCPAMDMISMNIKMHLLSHGLKNVNILSILSPAWTTEWMTEEGKMKLKEYGIAAPHKLSQSETFIECPQCNSTNTKLLSQFGSTACKALYQCNDCREPFDYFKCH